MPEGEADRMRNNLVVAALALGLAAMAAACSEPPKTEVDAVKATLDEAAVAGAREFAVESFKAAEDARATLDAELQAQEGKWFPSYTRAAELAAAAKTAADKAVGDATAGKEKARADATAAIEQARTVLAETQVLLDKAPKGKGTAADIEAMKTDLLTAGTTISEAEAALAGENFLQALAKAEAAQSIAGTVKTAVEAAVAAKGKR